MENSEIKNPVLSAIFEVDGGVVSVKGNVGNEFAKALHEVYGIKVDPESGYVLESMQQDQELNKLILGSVVAEKEHYNNQQKYYNLIWSVDPAQLSPIDLIDFKAAANETANDVENKSSMAVFIPENKDSDDKEYPTMKSVKEVANDNSIKIIYGTESLIQHLKGL